MYDTRKMKFYIRHKERYLIGIVFFAFFVFQSVQIFRFNFFVQSDDFGYIADAAFFAGYNWNPYTGDMTPYYNIGFPLLSSWAFKCFNNPISIYRCLLFNIVLCQMLTMFVVYRLSNKFFGMTTGKAAIIAFLYSIGSMAPQNGLYYMAEVPFAFCCIFSLYLMLETANAINKKKKRIWSAALAITIAYSYIVHTRFLVLIGTVCLICVFYHFKYKKSLIDYVSFSVVFVVTFVIALIGAKYVQEILYQTNVYSGAVTGNDALSRLGYIGDFLKIFTSWQGIKRFVKTLISLVAVYTLLTAGMIWVSGIITISKVSKILKLKKISNEEEAFFIVSVFGLVSFIGMNILISINGATNVHEYKWATYYRYGKPFVGILLIVALVVLWNRYMTKTEILVSAIGIIVSLYCVIRFTMRMLLFADYADVSAVGWMQYYLYDGQSIEQYFVEITTLVAFIAILIFACFIWHRRRIALGIFISFSLVLTCSENAFNEKISEKNYQMVDESLNFMNEYKDKIDKPIYFLQGSYSGRLRFALYDVEMHYLLSEEELLDIDYENAVLFSDKELIGQNINNNKNQPRYKIVLDDYEYVYTSNKKMYEYFTQ